MEELIHTLKLQNIECEFKEENGISAIIVHSHKLEDINRVIDLVKETNSNIDQILVDLPTSKPAFGMDYLKNISDASITYFCSRDGITKFSVADLMKLENLLDLMVKDIKESDLSPYEKYIAVYNIVRSFKQYQYYENSETKDHEVPDQSRNIYLILMNEWIVCVGYSQLLNELLKKVDISSIHWIVDHRKHLRSYVHIQDEKYNIDGFYMCDPTWDRTQEDIILKPGVHMNMTLEQSHRLCPDLDIDDRLLSSDPFDMLSYLKNDANRAKLKYIISSLDPEYFLSIEEDFNSFGLNPVYDPDFMMGLVPKTEYCFAQKLCYYMDDRFGKPIDGKVQAQASVRVQEFINGEKYSEEEFHKRCLECMENLEMAIENYQQNYQGKRK